MSFDNESEAVTQDYFAMGSETQDVYYRDSVLLNKLLKNQQGIYKKIPGGKVTRVPLVYDVAEGGAWDRYDSLKKTDKQMVDSAQFWLKNYHSVAVVNQVSEWENSGPSAFVDLVVTKIAGAQKKISKDLGEDLYSSADDEGKLLTGLLSLCNTTTTRAYGNITEDGLVASDGTKPWAGVVNSTSTVMSLEAMQSLRSSAKVGNGDSDKPNLFVTTETLFNKISRILQAQQRFTASNDPTVLGFTSLLIDGATMVVDDYCPANHCFALNTNHIGFGVQVDFTRGKWKEEDAPPSRYMHIIWRGNMLCNHRKAHAVHTALTVS